MRGYYERKPDWLVRPLGIDKVRGAGRSMEAQAHRFYVEAAQTHDRCVDAQAARRSGGGGAGASRRSPADSALNAHARGRATRRSAQTERRQFILTYVQPGLAGLMDGSVSTLAPIFAAAFATQDTWQTFLVGLSASVGAGISMGFTEAAHDDGKLSGRGSPLKRGLASGIMTAIGGLGHALPYLIPHFWTATTIADRRRVRRTVGDRLHPEPLHGNAVLARRLPGGAGRLAGVRRRGDDRQRVRRRAAHCCVKDFEDAGRTTEFPRLVLHCGQEGLAHAREPRLGRHVIEGDASGFTERRHPDNPVAFLRQEDKAVLNPTPHIVRRLVGEPARQNRMVAAVIVGTKLE